MEASSHPRQERFDQLGLPRLGIPGEPGSTRRVAAQRPRHRVGDGVVKTAVRSDREPDRQRHPRRQHHVRHDPASPADQPAVIGVEFRRGILLGAGLPGERVVLLALQALVAALNETAARGDDVRLLP